MQPLTYPINIDVRVGASFSFHMYVCRENYEKGCGEQLMFCEDNEEEQRCKYIIIFFIVLPKVFW